MLKGIARPLKSAQCCQGIRAGWEVGHLPCEQHRGGVYDNQRDLTGEFLQLGLILGGSLFYARVTFKTLVVFNFKVP